MEHLELKKKITIMIAVMSVMLFAALNMTIVGTSLPKIVAEIGGIEYFNWVFTSYMLASTITAILAGKLSDIYGRKILILIGICVFIVGSLLCGFSTSIIQLIIFRGIQGLGGGMIMSTAFTGDLFSPRERGRWQGILGSVFGLSSLFGPTLGGYIVDNMDWSWVFWIFLPIGIIGFFMILALYPQPKGNVKEKIDYLGSFVLTIAILTLLLGFSWAGNNHPWNSYEIIILFSVSFISLILFIYIESKVESPVLPLHLFKNSIVSISNLVSLFSGMGMYAVIMYVPFYVQGVLGRSATTSGIVEMIMTISMVAFSIFSGQLITKTGKYKILGLVGFTIMATGIFLCSRLTFDTQLTTLVINLVITGIGLGMTMPIFTLTVQNAVEHKFLGVATATSQLFRQIGATVGVAIMGYIMGTTMKERIREQGIPQLPEGVVEGESLSPQILMNHEAIEGIKNNLPSEFLPHFEEVIFTLREALNYSLTQVFLWSAILVVVAFVMTLFLKEIPLRTSNEKTKCEGTGDELSIEETVLN